MKKQMLIFSISLMLISVVLNMIISAGYADLTTKDMIKILSLSIGVGSVVSLVATMLFFEKLMKPFREMKVQLDITMEENKKMDNLRREFVANVSHELKTPLTSISGFIETLQGKAGEDSEIRRKFLDIIAIESARLERLIEDILIISAIENKRESIKNQDVNVKKGIEEVIASLEPLAMKKNIKIEFIYTYEMYIGGDYDRFKQLMMNLIENAIKYSNPGTTVFVNAVKVEKQIRIEVKDQGIGIDQENISRLFERFYRADKSRSQKVGGTGLGLAIAKHIVTLFNGEILVESEINKGSTFTVVFYDQ